MVARHNRRTGWHSADGCVCIDCGTRYLFTNTYKGNYCPDCHEAWVDRQKRATASRRPPRLHPSAHPSTDDAEQSDDVYDDE